MMIRIQYLLLAAVTIAALVVSSVSLNRAMRARSLLKCAEDKAESQARELHKELEFLKLLRLAAVVENSIGPADKDHFDRALKIRNHIHHTVSTNFTSESFDSHSIDYMYTQAMRDEESGHMCGGMTILYIAALESQGIPARYVGIFADDKEPYLSHASCEFWYNGKWYASDPTHNHMFMHKGEYLSYAEIFDLVQNGTPFEVVTNGFTVAADRKIDNYPAVLKGFMHYMVIHPSDVWRGQKSLPDTNKVQLVGFNRGASSTDGAPKQFPHSLSTDKTQVVEFKPASSTREAPNQVPQSLSAGPRREKVIHYPMQLFPKGWDGAITFRDGERKDVRGFGGVYAFLHTGPLR
jgi:hypothetical protein